MKKFTKKQRREIYLKAIKAYFKRPDNRKYLCGALADVLKIDTIYHVGGGLPEFDLFEPTKKEREGSLLWWNSYSEHYDNNRINCLLFCAEMCR